MKNESLHSLYNSLNEKDKLKIRKLLIRCDIILESNEKANLFIDFIDKNKIKLSSSGMLVNIGK